MVFTQWHMGPGFAQPEPADIETFADVNAVRAEMLNRFRGQSYSAARGRTVYYANVTTEAFALIWNTDPRENVDMGPDTADHILDFGDPILDAYLQIAGILD